ncbi:anthranilate synthase component II [Sediminibacillus massiliensis]|uniref:anthranilate synthase component II n=1 Tax=Sediminibacillus massiliensis TaxID=1926277 RepID=UPI0009885B05|nr:aminodeoxychorismate/anthranilate synthase component II [Sediminibacillus massiliensis]
MIVVIDNYDSFTYNLVQYFKQMTPAVRVFSNDQASLHDIETLEPDLIVLSPGPGTPDDSGICMDVVDYFHESIPILGVCLGHQVIVTYFGGKVIKGKKPMHGKVTNISHKRTGVYSGIQSPAQVTRYHSLIADETSFPKDLEVTARSEDDVIMGIRHQSHPVNGIQFHPESILTLDGYHMLENCYNLAREWKELRRGGDMHYEPLSTV